MVRYIDMLSIAVVYFAQLVSVIVCHNVSLCFHFLYWLIPAEDFILPYKIRYFESSWAAQKQPVLFNTPNKIRHQSILHTQDCWNKLVAIYKPAADLLQA